MFKKLGWIIKRLPHPTYGSYGGFYKRCSNRKKGICPRPIDWMDKVFQEHDSGLSNTKLVNRLKQGNSSALRFYGKLYRLGTILVFSIAIKF